ncbi:MAG: FG-GAP-like repeat-containing protein [Planctomycetota bacterium]
MAFCHSSLVRRTLALVPASALATVASAQTTHFSYPGPSSTGFGSALASPGDVDGDGLADVAVSSPFEAAGGVNNAGRVRLLSGADGAVLWTANGTSFRAYTGLAMDDIADLDGDGVRDLVVGNPLFNSQAPAFRGEVLVLSGASGAQIHRIVGQNSDENLGFDVAEIGDLNGDGVSDFIAGQPTDSTVAPSQGRATVFSGATGAVLQIFDGFGAGSRFGTSVDGADDFDGDGTPDVLIGAPFEDSQFGSPGNGSVRVLSGATGAVLFTRFGQYANVNLGTSVANAGDLDGDGIADLAAGAPRFIPAARGRVYAYSGATGQDLYTQRGANSGDRFGETVAAAGDVDGDGMGDLLVAGVRDSGPITDIGRVTVLSGSSGTELLEVRSGGFDSTSPFALAAADVNGDGFADVLSGRPQNDRVVSFGRDAATNDLACLGRPNSTGERGALMATSPSGFSAAANDVTFDVTGLPLQSAGYFVVSRTPEFTPFAGGSSGTLCVGGAVGRFAGSILSSGAIGAVTFSPDVTAIPIPGSSGGAVAAMPGDTFTFQHWYRDVAGGGGATSNFSDAFTVEFQ